jgi:hypothetical protein
VERARTAHDALSAMLAPPQVGPLVEALVAKYVALSSDELEEWQSDPEGYIRSLELEAAPDADTPRPVGVGLLLCMLERGGEGPGRALIDLAATLQVPHARRPPRGSSARGLAPPPHPCHTLLDRRRLPSLSPAPRSRSPRARARRPRCY